MRKAALFAVLLALLAPAARAEAPIPFEDEMIALEAADRQRTPAEGAVLFVGSSSIHKWETLAQDFPGVPVANRGIDGFELSDCVRLAGRLLGPFRDRHPKRIVLYAGDNDVADGLAPSAVAARFEAFVAEARRLLPGVPVTFVSIKLSPARRRLAAKIIAANDLVRRYVESQPDLDYVDVYTPMRRAQREGRELFGKDGLHMSRAGYEIWRDALAPRL